MALYYSSQAGIGPIISLMEAYPDERSRRHNTEEDTKQNIYVNYVGRDENIQMVNDLSCNYSQCLG